MTATGTIPAAVGADGVEWLVARAWPSAVGADVELRRPDDDGVRAGHWTADDGVRLLGAGADPRLPGLVVARKEGPVIVHRAGRRAVVRAIDGGSYLKVVRPASVDRLLSAHRSAGGFANGFAIPTVLGAGSDGIVRFAALPGRTLLDFGSDPTTTGSDWAALWDDWAEAWLALPEADPRLPVHTAADEARIVETWTAHALRVIGDCPRLPDAAAAVIEALADAPGPLVLSHRDLHDQQMLRSAEGLGLLDLDTAARAEAALDLGNLRAHLTWRVHQGLLGSAFAARGIATVDRVAGTLGVQSDRLAAYETAAEYRLGCLYLFRPAWRELSADFLRSTVKGLLT